MSGLRSTAQRLQTALTASGRNVSINSRQFYSTKYQKIVTCWKVREDNKLVLKTYSTVAVVQKLAEMYKEVRDDAATAEENEIRGGVHTLEQPDPGGD